MSYLFHGQRNHEEVVLIVKQHPFVLLHPLIISVFLLWVPFVLFAVLNFGSLLLGLTIGFVLAAFIHGGLAFYGWLNSIFLLTNERLVLLEQRGVLHREFAEIDLNTIQQASHQVKGMLRTFFGYGTISIFTGGAQEPMKIANIPDPYDVQQKILQVAKKEDFQEE